MNLLWQFFNATGLNFNVVNSQILKKYSSHLVTLVVASFVHFFFFFSSLPFSIGSFWIFGGTGQPFAMILNRISSVSIEIRTLILLMSEPTSYHCANILSNVNDYCHYSSDPLCNAFYSTIGSSNDLIT